jgi:molecular chaperone GrpE
MNEDQDFNESLASEDATKENADVTQNDENSENLGEAVIAAAKKGVNIEKKKKAKFFSKNDKDDQQDAKIAELTNDLQRTRADFENFRRQSDIQKQHYGNVVKMTTVKKVLPLLDDIERAAVAQPEAMAPIMKNFEKTLKELGLTKIASNKGEAFNPDLHDAVMVDGDGDEEVIEETLRAGYYYDGEVLRPAMVKVSKQ